MSKQLKAISIRQPWAHLIVHGIDGYFKDVENRDWVNAFLYYRGPLFIHASKRLDGVTRDVLERFLPFNLAELMLDKMEMGELQLGGIIGVVDFVNVFDSDYMVQRVRLKSKWFVGKYGLVFQNPKAVKFLPCRGQLGLWNFSHRPFEGLLDSGGLGRRCGQYGERTA